MLVGEQLIVFLNGRSFIKSDGAAEKTKSSKTIFDALGLQPKVVDGAEEEVSLRGSTPFLLER